MKNLQNLRRSSQFAVLLFLLIQVIGFKGYGRTNYPDYVDGIVYMEVNNTSAVSLPNYHAGDPMTGMPAEIVTIINSYQVDSIAKAFPYTATILLLIEFINYIFQV